MDISDFLTMSSNGDLIQTHAQGTNISFNCEICLHTVLASSKDNMPGSNEKTPVYCKGCNQKYFLDIRERAEKLYIHAI